MVRSYSSFQEKDMSCCLNVKFILKLDDPASVLPQFTLYADKCFKQQNK